MTDVLTRPDDIAGPQPEPPTPPEPVPPPASTAPGTAVVALASFTAAAGLIHLVMTPSHVGESALEGAGFLVAAWVQLGLAIALVRAATPRRGLLGLAATTDLALIGLWAVSRTVGLPLVGEHAGHAATVSLVDGATVAFEAAAVLVAIALLRRPGLGARTGGAAALAVPLVVMALTSAVVASPSARDHAAGSHGEHAAGAHDGAAMAGEHAHGDGAAVPEDDRGWSLLANGHDHGATELVELDDATQATLDDQLAVTGELVARYPTAAEAMAAGYRRAGPFTPGLGTHYIGPMKMVSGTMDRDELLSPVLIFDGPGAEAPLAGFMYLSIGTQTPPEGFAGPNDHWHYHENVCLIPRADGGLDTPFGADETEVTESMCTEIGGHWLPVVQNMVHVWTVPGYEHPDNVFGDLNPAITCPDGSYYRLDWRESGTRPTLCVNP